MSSAAQHRRSRRCAACAPSPVSLLRRAHAHHRDLRGRLPASDPAIRAKRRTKGRHVVTAAAHCRSHHRRSLLSLVTHRPRWRLLRSLLHEACQHLSLALSQHLRRRYRPAFIDRPSTRSISATLAPTAARCTRHDHSNPHSARHRRVPIPRGFLPWRLPYAGPGACGCVRAGRHPEPLYGAFEVKHLFHGILHFLLLPSFFVRLGSPFLRPDPHVLDAGAHRGCQGRPSLRQCLTLRRFQAAP